MEKLVNQVMNAFYSGDRKRSDLKLTKTQIVDFLELLFSTYPSSSSTRFLLINSFIPRELTLVDWKVLITKLKDRDSALLDVLTFLHKYLGINSEELFLSLKIDSIGWDSIRDCPFYKAMINKYDIMDLKKYEIDYTNLHRINCELVNQGATRTKVSCLLDYM